MEWNLDKILSLIEEGIEEHHQLEYKSGKLLTISPNGKINNDLKPKLSKIVSAFSNSNGGTIIIGIEEGKGAKRHLPIDIEWVDFETFTKERLEEIVQNSVNPIIHDFKIFPIKKDTNSNLGLYVLEIKQGLKPYQAQDLVYYGRRNFKNDGLLDYEINEIRNRASFADLEVAVEVEDNSTKVPLLFSKDKENPKDLFPNYVIKVIVSNTGKYLINNIKCFVEYDSLFKSQVIKHTFENSSRDEYSFTIGDKTNRLQGPKYSEPLHVGTYDTLGSFEISKQDLFSDELLKIHVSFDNSEPKKESICLKELLK